MADRFSCGVRETNYCLDYSVMSCPLLITYSTFQVNEPHPQPFSLLRRGALCSIQMKIAVTSLCLCASVVYKYNILAKPRLYWTDTAKMWQYNFLVGRVSYPPITDGRDAHHTRVANGQL
ncbi:hypothetical protein NIES4103_52200 [Nostoc sp. NIES-4103]|nr:hypothetical protein NIES4103_52200 [Nostoc sp. NIES-4103]